MNKKILCFFLSVIYFCIGTISLGQTTLSSKRPPAVKNNQKGAYQKYEPENLSPFRKHTQFNKPVMIEEKQPPFNPADTINRYRKVEKYFVTGNKSYIDANPALYTLSSKHNLPQEQVVTVTDTPTRYVAPVIKYPTKVRGYRIQLFNGQERDQANRLKNQFASNFPNIPRYLVFVEPTYRVRVGDFYTKGDAESFLKEVKRIASFSDAIIIRDIVEFKPPKEESAPIENR
ncbi:MAG: SPOR domain-containing protein [Bacteroidia bacterium]|nr:SPOR domain-containing protein [Bacteroidia bacterium]